MKILVTGAAGFIGSHLCERLLSGDHHVIGLDNFLTGREQNMPKGHPNFRWTRGDVASTSFDQADVIVHCAGSYNDPEAWVRDLRTNAIGTAEVTRHAQRTGARLIYLQTSLCYGINPGPFPLSLNASLHPQGSYAVSKTTGEQYIRDSGIDYVSFRLANIYGPRNLSGPIPTFYKKIVGGEQCTISDTRRDFVYVQDAVDVFVKAVNGIGRGIYHVSSGSDVAIEDVYLAVNDHFPPARYELVERSPDDAATILLDPIRTLYDFSWAATTPLEDGIADAIIWYEQNGVDRTFTHLRTA